MHFVSSVPTTAILSEFSAASLGDRRLTRRLLSLVRDVCRAPAKSLPILLPSAAKREAAYRFFANSAVTPEVLLKPHVSETQKRAAAAGDIRVIHDTSRFVFTGDREDLAILTKETRGFLGHFALATGATELREPLGVLGMRLFVNDDAAVAARRKKSKTQVLAEWRETPREKKARHRWESAAIEVDERLPPGTRAVHVMDQEADDFHVFYSLQNAGLLFVIRGAPTRLTEEGLRVDEVLEAEPQHAFRTVRVSRRPKVRGRTRHDPRDERQAELQIRFGPVSIRRPQHVKKQIPAEYLALNAVHVFEPNPPEGEEPIEWLLFTSLSVSTLDDALAVVDHYRARWIIEEFFKALKTGCSFEKRQLTTYDGLKRLLAVFVPIAWQLLRMRYLARQSTPPPAEAVMDSDQLRLLRVLLRQNGCDYKLAAEPSTRDVLFAIAALGGHIRNNGDPGWLVIGRGYEEFLAAARGWDAARCDQS